MGEVSLHNFMNFNEPQINYHEVLDIISNIQTETLRKKEMIVKGIFSGDGSSAISRYNK